jgi:hypothetical protein
VFGDDFAKGEVLEKAASFSASVLRRDAGSVQLVAAIRTLGQSILARIPAYLPHVEKVPWQSNVQQLPVSVRAAEYTRENGEFIRELESGTVMQKGHSIRFEAHLFLGLPQDFFVKWRVVNTGEEAARANELRGTFYGEGDGKVHWESTLYTGVHWVEAFVVNRRDNKCVGRSERFFVVIE